MAGGREWLWVDSLSSKGKRQTLPILLFLKTDPWSLNCHGPRNCAFFLLPLVIPFNFCISCLYSALSANPRKMLDAKPDRQQLNFPPVIKGCTKTIATTCLRVHLVHKPSKLRHSTPEKAPVDISLHQNSLKSSLASRSASARWGIKLTKVRGLISFIFVL